MAQRRSLNSSRVLAERSPRGGESHHISTRKIDNGYLIEKSTCTETGEYRSSCEFSSEAPKITPARVGRMNLAGSDATGSRGLGDAVRYAKGN